MKKSSNCLWNLFKRVPNLVSGPLYLLIVIVKDLFIQRPMMWQYVLSFNLDILIFIWFIINIPQVWWQWGIVIGYTIISLIYYKINQEDMIDDFISKYVQLNKKSSPTSSKYFFSAMLTLSKFIFMGIFLKVVAEEWFVETSFIYHLPMIAVIFFMLSKMLYDSSLMPQVYLYVFMFLSIAVLSLVGIEKGILGWTFVALILTNFFPQFLNEDIISFLPKNTVKVIRNRYKEVIKESLVRIKCQVLLFVPFFYLALVISESIIYSDEFNYLYNYLRSTHYDIRSVSYLSELNMVAIYFKTVILSPILVIFFEYKDRITDNLSRFILLKILKNKFPITLYGRFNKVRFTRRHWVLDESDYYLCLKNSFQISRKEVYTYQNNTLKSRDGNLKKAKIVSEDILLIDDNYYVKSSSEIYRTLSSKNRVMGYKLLKRLDYSHLLFPFVLLIITFGVANLANDSMTKNLRGEYVLVYYNKDYRAIIDESQKLEFYNETVLFNHQEYKVNNVTMQIQNKNNEIIGEYTRRGILSIIDESHKQNYYVWRSSELYKISKHK